MWMPAHTTRPPLRTALQRLRHQFAHRGEDDGGVQGFGRRMVGVSGPVGADVTWQIPGPSFCPAG